MADRALLPSNLRREHGDIKISEYKSREWAKGLEYRQLFDLTKEEPPMEPTQVIYDETRGATIVGVKFQGNTAKSATIEMIPDEGPWDRDQAPIWSPAAPRISSLSLSSTGCILSVYPVVVDSPNGSLTSHSATTVGGVGPGSVCLDIDGLLQRGLTHEPYVLDAPHVLDAPRLLNGRTSYWASAANPTPGLISCAIATSNGAFIQTAHGRGWGAEGGLSLDAPEVMAVDWESENVVIMGCKDGEVRLWDKRLPAEESQRFQHQSQINHAKWCPDVNQIVVAGLDSRLCAYDPRFTKEPTYSFPEYNNSRLGHLAAGFDVCGTYVAATSEDECIHIWDLGINAPEHKPEGNNMLRKVQGHANCLKFDQKDDEPPRLLVATKGEIREIAWPREGRDVTLP